MAMFEKEMRHAVEFIPNRLYYVALSSSPPSGQANKHFFSIDNEMVYWNFYLDFGPLNLGHVYRYCQVLNNKLNDPKHQDKVIYHFSHTHAHKRTNAAFLICAWFMLYQNKLPEEAFRPFKGYIAPFPPWHDATPSPCTFNLTILDTLKGLYRAREHRFFDLANFNIEEYEHYEQVENGDLNWCMDGKFLAFAGPHAERTFSPGGYHTLRPEDYMNYFKRRNVTLVVRLNKPYYDARKFQAQGIDHIDLYFLDGSNPPDHILARFIQKAEETPGGVAVHCKAGLGRTGTCIAAYMMKHFRLTAEEVIGWLRIVRPGSVIGPQQQYLKEIQNRMWRDGDAMRSRPSANPSLPYVAGGNGDGLPGNQLGQTGSGNIRPGSSNGLSSSGAAVLGAPNSPYAPNTPQSSSAAKRLGSVSSNSKLVHGGAPSGSLTPSGGSSKTGSSSMAAGGITALQSPNGSHLTASTGVSSSRPSSRSASRPDTSNSYGSNNSTEEKEGSQGDQLRLRRQQHLQNSAVYSLSSPTSSHTPSHSATHSATSAAMTPPKSRLTFGSNGADNMTSPSGSNAAGSSGTPNSANRPRSRLGGFLSSWNK